MNNRPIDKSKKKNVKCEHCEYFNPNQCYCYKICASKHYYNRCKQFEWAKNKKYIGE